MHISVIRRIRKTSNFRVVTLSAEQLYVITVARILEFEHRTDNLEVINHFYLL